MRSVTILFSLLLIVGAHTVFAQDPNGPTDAEYTKAIIGTWTLGKDDEYYGKQWFKLEYKADGTSWYQGYKTAKCEEPELTVHGSWTIQDGKLINTALRGSGGTKIKFGLTFVDTIELLTDTDMKVKTADGRVIHRSKVLPCQTE